VFRPSGGTNIEYDRGGDWYVMVDVVSSKRILMLRTLRLTPSSNTSARNLTMTASAR
jgi:hypothetical protein